MFLAVKSGEEIGRYLRLVVELLEVECGFEGSVNVGMMMGVISVCGDDEV